MNVQDFLVQGIIFITIFSLHVKGSAIFPTTKNACASGYKKSINEFGYNIALVPGKLANYHTTAFINKCGKLCTDQVLGCHMYQVSNEHDRVIDWCINRTVCWEKDTNSDANVFKPHSSWRNWECSMARKENGTLTVATTLEELYRKTQPVHKLAWRLACIKGSIKNNRK